MKLNFKPCLAYFSDGVAQSQMDTMIITSDFPPSPHQTTPPPQNDMEEHAHMSPQLPHPPTITSLNFCTDFVVKPMDFHVPFLPQPLSSCLVDPLNCIVLCSFVLDSTPVVNED